MAAMAPGRLDACGCSRGPDERAGSLQDCLYHCTPIPQAVLCYVPVVRLLVTDMMTNIAFGRLEKHIDSLVHKNKKSHYYDDDQLVRAQP